MTPVQRVGKQASQDGPTTGSDSIGIILVSWSDTKIVLCGFGSSLNTNSQWALTAGDPMLIEIQTTSGQATYKTTVTQSQSNQNPTSGSTGAPPAITLVSPISSELSQTITIQGSGFGNIQPQLLSLGDGSVDTVWGGSTPSIVVYDKSNELSAGATGNWPGFTNGSPDLIGVILVSWTNAQIVLGGFGSGLDSQFSWSQVSQGDNIQIQIQTVSGFATYNTIAVSNQSNQNPISGSTGVPPTITSVSPISATRLQTITIQGSSFGNIQPQTVSLGDGSVDTIDGGSTPSMQIRDNHLIAGWTAGYGGNGIGIILVSWSNSEIVLGGFGALLTTNTNGQGSNNLMPGDSIQILVKVSGAVTSYNTAVLGSQENTNQTNNGSAPVISSVSPISTISSQTITIRGSDFENIQPQLLSLGDGSVDTVGGGSTPVIQIHDDGWYGWEAGTQDGPTTGCDSIGIILVSWSDTEIVLGGFGSSLNTNSQWMLSQGDPMRIVVLTSGGVGKYETTVGGSGTSSNSNTTSSTPSPSPTTVPATTDSNVTVDLVISGNITSSQMSNVTIATNLSDNTTTVSFTVTGESGTTGFCNITIPMNVVLNGTTPTIYIDGHPAQNQGYTQDANNYYVWYTTHFSTHQITIVFTKTSSSSNPKAQSSLLQVIYGLVAAVAVVATVLVGLYWYLGKAINAKLTRENS